MAVPDARLKTDAPYPISAARYDDDDHFSSFSLIKVTDGAGINSRIMTLC